MFDESGLYVEIINIFFFVDYSVKERGQIILGDFLTN